jgi:pimeloyl-ACP methyl ester carboxylesterase
MRPQVRVNTSRSIFSNSHNESVMSDSCDQPATCTSAGATTRIEPLSPESVLSRFEHEAIRGTCDTGRYRMPYYVWGKGPPLLLIHGAGDTSRSFLFLAAELSTRFRCIVYDLPSGHGDGANLWRYQPGHLTADALALLDSLQVDRCYVLGSSFGSTIALGLLHGWSSRFPRGIVQGGLVHRPLRRAERVLSWLGRFLPGSTARIPRRDRILARVHRAPFERQPADVWQAFLSWTGQARLSALAHQARWLGRLDLRPHLPAIQQPVLIVHGDRDPLSPLRCAEELRQGLPSSGLVVLEDCGHHPYYTHPEVLAEVIRQFLTPPGAEDVPCGQRGPQCDTCPSRRGVTSSAAE